MKNSFYRRILNLIVKTVPTFATQWIWHDDSNGNLLRHGRSSLVKSWQKACGWAWGEAVWGLYNFICRPRGLRPQLNSQIKRKTIFRTNRSTFVYTQLTRQEIANLVNWIALVFISEAKSFDSNKPITAKTKSKYWGGPNKWRKST